MPSVSVSTLLSSSSALDDSLVEDEELDDVALLLVLSTADELAALLILSAAAKFSTLQVQSSGSTDIAVCHARLAPGDGSSFVSDSVELSLVSVPFVLSVSINKVSF